MSLFHVVIYRLSPFSVAMYRTLEDGLEKGDKSHYMAVLLPDYCQQVVMFSCLLVYDLAADLSI